MCPPAMERLLQDEHFLKRYQRDSQGQTKSELRMSSMRILQDVLSSENLISFLSMPLFLGEKAIG